MKKYEYVSVHIGKLVGAKTMASNAEFLTKRDLKVKLIEELPV